MHEMTLITEVCIIMDVARRKIGTVKTAIVENISEIF